MSYGGREQRQHMPPFLSAQMHVAHQQMLTPRPSDELDTPLMQVILHPDRASAAQRRLLAGGVNSPAGRGCLASGLARNQTRWTRYVRKPDAPMSGAYDS
jgi:hypothetical protein